MPRHTDPASRVCLTCTYQAVQISRLREQVRQITEERDRLKRTLALVEAMGERIESLVLPKESDRCTPSPLP